MFLVLFLFKCLKEEMNGHLGWSFESMLSSIKGAMLICISTIEVLCNISMIIAIILV